MFILGVVEMETLGADEEGTHDCRERKKWDGGVQNHTLKGTTGGEKRGLGENSLLA